uniref:Outer dense fiber protein 3 n=1 Tax=Anopheles farauti TaxID=69004 RepID=A0A182QIR9_9DIPT
MSQQNKGPGPAAYSLPRELGHENHDPRKERKPMYSMRPRASVKFETIGPGPAKYDLKKYTRDGPPRDPKYTLAGRTNEQSQDFMPGPGAHNNHLVPTMKCKRPPQYSFGLRIDKTDKEMVPAPNRYDGKIHMIRPKAPCYSILLVRDFDVAIKSPSTIVPRNSIKSRLHPLKNLARDSAAGRKRSRRR